MDRYERLHNFDFAGADAYWTATSSFWALGAAWLGAAAAQHPRFRVRATCNGEDAFVPFFRTAGRLEAGEAISPDAQRAEIERILDCVVSTD